MLTGFLIFLVGLLAIATAFYTVVARHPIYGAISLVGHVLTIGLIYLSLGSTILAVLQVLIYAGAIVVLFVYAVMYVDPDVEQIFKPEGKGKIIGAAVAGLLFFAVTAFCLKAAEGDMAGPGAAEHALPYELLSMALFQKYLVPFEAVSILLLVAIIGAVYLARIRLRAELPKPRDPGAPSEDPTSVQGGMHG